MPRLRTVRTKEEAQAIPVDQAVNVDLTEQEEAVVAQAEATGDGKQAKKNGSAKAPADDIVAGDAPEAPDEGKVELSALQKRVQELEQAERRQKEQYENQIRELEAARRRAEREASEKVSKYQGEAEDAQYDAIQAALAAANADVEVAQRALEIAEETGDPKAKAKAYRDLSLATARVTQYEDGKAAYERAREERKANPPKHEEHPDDRFEAAIKDFPVNAKIWLRAHPQYLTDASKNADLQYFHQTAIREGKQFDTPEYYESLETHLGLRARPQPAPEPVDEDPDVEVVASPPQRSRVVSQAPPSRDVPSAGSGQRQSPTKVTLTPEERDIAQRAGITDVEYAKMKVKLAQMKQNGYYTEK